MKFKVGDLLVLPDSHYEDGSTEFGIVLALEVLSIACNAPMAWGDITIWWSPDRYNPNGVIAAYHHDQIIGWRVAD